MLLYELKINAIQAKTVLLNTCVVWLIILKSWIVTTCSCCSGCSEQRSLGFGVMRQTAAEAPQ